MNWFRIGTIWLSLLLITGPTSADFFSGIGAPAGYCPSSPCQVVVAHLQAGSDSGNKIAAAIAKLPSGIGGIVDATGFTNPQNITGFTVTPGVTVLLSPVFHTMPCGNPIIVQQGGHLIGHGANSPGSTTIKLFNNCNHEIIRAISSAGESNWWHNAEVRNILLDGNKANNTTGHCMTVYALAETSLIQRMTIKNCKEAGVYIKGSQSGTGSIENITVNDNGTYGVQLDEFKSGLLLKSVGGDNNPATAGITGPNTGGGAVTFVDFKSEKSAVAGPAVEYIPGSAATTLTFLGGNALQSGVADTTFLHIANVVGQQSPQIQIMGLFTGNNYTTIIDDELTANQITSDPVTYHGLLMYRAGKWAKFDAAGWSVSP